MKSKESKLIQGTRTKAILWIAAWVLLVALSMDFYNWGKLPRLVLGMPLWLWAEIGMVLLIALVYGILAHFTWEDASYPGKQSKDLTGGRGGNRMQGGCGEASNGGLE